MTRTPDAHAGELLEDDGIIVGEVAVDPAVQGEIRRVVGKGFLTFVDGSLRGLGEDRENIWQHPVDDRDVNTPPGSPTTGYRVIIGSSPTGDFSGHAGELAQWNGSAWVFTTPKAGTVAHVKDEAQPYRQTAASAPWAWSAFAGGGPHAPTHSHMGSDEVKAQDLGSGTAPLGKLLQADGSGGWNLVDYVPGYPAALEYSSDDVPSTTTSSLFLDKLTHVTTDLALGHYLIFAQAVLSGTANNTEAEGQVLLDGSIIVQNITARLSRVSAEFPMMTMYVMDEVSGVHTIKIQYRKAGGSGSASIRAARVILWRIS